ncbi:MAG: FAD-dependent monooxygenase [Pseudomonadota bacterium]
MVWTNAPQQRITRAMAQTHYDIAVVGGGLAGKTLAAALSAQDFDVVLIERESTAAADNRVTSLNMSTVQMYRNIGAWQHMKAHAQAMADIRVVDGPAGPSISFETLSTFGEAHGYVVHNEVIVAALDKTLKGTKSVMTVHGTAAALGQALAGSQQLNLSNGKTIDASLICACDGARSPLRSALGIETSMTDYRQANITATLDHANDHAGVGFQRFMPGGPVAFIPMQGQQSSLAWTLPKAQARAVMALDDDAFMALLSDQIFRGDNADARGPFTAASARSTYPLRAQIAERLDGPRCVLVGDAAHTIHPLAGQGFNLTARDIAALTDILLAARSVGEDIGSARHGHSYTRARRADILALFVATDQLNRLFSSRRFGPRALRRAIMAAGRILPKVGTGFALQAQGALLGLPSLMRG